jgi:hypothetical protein
MPQYTYPIAFPEDDIHQTRGYLELEDPIPYETRSPEGGFYRQGRIALDGCAALDMVLYHSQATAEFMYVHDRPVDMSLFEIAGVPREAVASIRSLPLPGQLCMGADRSKIIGQAVQDIFASPALCAVLASHQQHNLAVFPIAREGLKYQVSDAIFENYGYYCDEIILDAHHVFDSSVPVYNRKVEMTLFKDKDLDQAQRENISVAFLADSIASGLVMTEVIERVKLRFENLQRVEVISPLATIRGLCRVARAKCSRNIHVRVHVFETLLNALPPDFYYSAHINIPEFHIRPDLEQTYRQWWGKDSNGKFIADTACAGYGWSEVFYSPRKQIQMMNSELKTRHNLTIADIILRHLG